MHSPDKNAVRFELIAFVVFAVAPAGASGCDNGAAKRAIVEKAQAQVRRIVVEIDNKTTETGVYERVKEDEIKEVDPWGTRLKVSYSQGGVAETVTVRSAGPDKQFQTNDDVAANGVAMNFKGVGEGIKKNSEETASNVAKGAVTGTVQGVKESIKDSLPFKRKKKDEPEPSADQDVKPETKSDAKESGE